MPGVVSVAPRVSGGLLDTVLKGVTVARDVYGIKNDMANTALTEQRTQQGAQQFEDQQAGLQPASEKINAMRYGTQVPANTAGATKMQFLGDTDESGAPSPTYMLPIKDTSPLQSTVQDAIVNGKHGTATYNMRPGPDGKSQLMNFVETARPVHDVTPHITSLGQDADGNVVTLDTTSGRTNTVALDSPLSKVGAAPKEVDHDKQGKIYTELVNKVTTPGRNKAVAQAQTNLLNIENANELIRQYPDTNNMPPQQVSLLYAELAKISSGGIGSEHGQKAQEVNTFRSKLAVLQQSTGNAPSGAQLGAFIAQNKAYLDGLHDVSQGVVAKYGQDIYKGYKDRLTPDQQDQFKAEFADLFKGQAGAQNVAGPVKGDGGFVGTANAAGAATPAGHPDDGAALKWAQQNIMSPDADKATKARLIIQVNGGK